MTNPTPTERDTLTSQIQSVSNAGGGVIDLPDRTILLDRGWIEIPANITLRGGASTALVLNAAPTEGWTPFFRVVGDNVKLENLTIRRDTDTTGVLLDVRASNGLTLDRVTLDGRRDTCPSEIHGVMIYGDQPQQITNVTMTRCTVRRLDFGVFQPSERTVTVTGFTVTNCVFEDSWSSDLEFNAPNSTMTGVHVTGCVFRNNHSPTETAGWGVGFANVHQSTITGNTFNDYAMNAIHIEDRSSDVTVSGNTFTNVSHRDTGYAAVIIIISGSRDITVTGNYFNARANRNRLDMVWVGHGGSPMEPDSVTVDRNIITLRAGSAAVGTYGATNVQSTANRVLTATVDAQLFDGGGQVGAPVTPASTAATGAPLRFTGDGTAVYAAPIHGGAAATTTTNSGAESAALVHDVLPGALEVSVQAYFRLPALTAMIAPIVLTTTSSRLRLECLPDGRLGVSFNGNHLADSPDPVLPTAGAPVRLAMRGTINGTTLSAVFAAFTGESTSPSIQAEFDLPLTAGEAFTTAEFGVTYVPPAQSPAAVTVDSIRVSTAPGAAAAWMPPQRQLATQRHDSWVRQAGGWRNSGTGRVLLDA